MWQRNTLLLHEHPPTEPSPYLQLLYGQVLASSVACRGNHCGTTDFYVQADHQARFRGVVVITLA